VGHDVSEITEKAVNEKRFNLSNNRIFAAKHIAIIGHE